MEATCRPRCADGGRDAVDGDPRAIAVQLVRLAAGAGPPIAERGGIDQCSNAIMHGRAPKGKLNDSGAARNTYWSVGAACAVEVCWPFCDSMKDKSPRHISSAETKDMTRRPMTTRVTGPGALS